MSFNIIPPVPIEGAMLISSTVAEPDVGEQVYNSGTTYAMDAEVISLSTHRKYKSLIDANVGHPLPVWPNKTNQWWFYVGRSNKWNMFDLRRSTPTVKTGALTVSFAPGARVDSLALRGLFATALEVSMSSGGTVVYTATRNLSRRQARNAFEYCFNPFDVQRSVTLFDLPPYANGVVTITLTSDFGPVQCGAVVVGRRIEAGKLLSDSTSDVMNFSVVVRDEDGNAELEPHPNVPLLDAQVLCPKEQLDAVRRVRDALAGTPAIWSGISDDADAYAESLDILGIYKKFTINPKHTTHAAVSLQLEAIYGADPTTNA